MQEHSHKPKEQSTPRHSPTLGARGSHTDLVRQFGVPRNLVHHPSPTAHHSHPKVIAALTSIETNLLLCVTTHADASKKGETVVRPLTFRPIPLSSPPVVDLMTPRSRPQHRAPQGLPNDRTWALFTVATFEAATERLLRGAGS